MKILLIGAGKMMEAIIEGWSSIHFQAEISVFTPSGVSAKKLSQNWNIKLVSDISRIETPDVVLLGCKPQHLKDLSSLIKGQFESVLFVSMLAAIDEEKQRQILGVKKLIRVMPNIPVRFLKGVTLLSSASAINDIHVAETLFKPLGKIFQLNENELDNYTLLTGCGPGVFYEFCNYLVHNPQWDKQEINEELIRAVFIGAAASLTHSILGLEELRNQVASKGGVTEAILSGLRESSIENLIHQSFEKGFIRSQELKRTISN